MITIEKASLTDVPELTALINKSYRGEQAMRGWTTESHLLDGQRIDEEILKEHLAEEGTVILKCYANDKLIGSVYTNKSGTDLYFGMLTVDPDKQNSGIGKLLLKHVEWFGRQQHCTRIHLTVISVRHELIAWYERRGYNRTGESKPFPTDTRFGIQKQPLVLIVMEKII